MNAVGRATGPSRCCAPRARPHVAFVAAPNAATARRSSVVAHAKQMAKWDVMFRYLTQERPLQSVAPEQAEQMVKSGKWVIVDVRPPSAYEQSHIENSVNVPMYKALNPLSSGVGGAFKFIAYSLNGVTPVETNEEFIQELNQATANGAKGVIFACEAGGTLRPSTNFALGKASRSLQASYRAFTEATMENVLHLERGLYGWYQADLPFKGEYKPDVGRTPSAAKDPTLKTTVMAAGYEMKPTDKK